MVITIKGRHKTGKTIIATKVKEMLESLGAIVVVNDMDEPKHISSGLKPLSGQKIIINVEYELNPSIYPRLDV